MEDNEILKFDGRRDNPSGLIKVIGVGGGGGNAISHMFKEGVEHVSFAICNTDRQALNKSDVPTKLQLGPGLGAGGVPSRGEEFANESIDRIQQMLDDGTEMVFITAGMGGGTGTGAGPIVAKVAKDMGILTVGIVTIPFLFEGRNKIMQALKGVEGMAKNVDALLVINNERLRGIYSDLTLVNAFAKADDTLSIAAKSIVDMISIDGVINIDFADVCTTLRDGGVAIISTGYGQGENRVQNAIEDALHSPLLNNTDIYKAKKILLFLTFSEKSNFMMEEMDAIHKFMDNFNNSNRNIKLIWGYALDNSLDTEIKLTILASGFGKDDIDKGDESFVEDKAVDDIIETFYPGMTAQNGRPRKKCIHIFTPEQLDDDNVISVIDSSATFNRDINVLKSLEATRKVVEEEVDEADDTITFD